MDHRCLGTESDEDDYVCENEPQKYDINRSVQINLQEDDVRLYAPFTRCPKGYRKIDLLGKGGCAVVWLCYHEQTRQKVAVKQFPKAARNDINYRSGFAEIKFH